MIPKTILLISYLTLSFGFIGFSVHAAPTVPNSNDEVTTQVDKGGNIVHVDKDGNIVQVDKEGKILAQPDVIVTENPQQTEPQQQPQSQPNNVLRYTEEKYIFNNSHLKGSYLVKFYDENDSFLISETLPYGRTIKILNEYGTLEEEYTVRQTATIQLNLTDYISSTASLKNFSSRIVKENNKDITIIYPIVSFNEGELPLEDENETSKSSIKKGELTSLESKKSGAIEYENTDSTSSTSSIFLGILLVILTLITGFYFYKRYKVKTN